MPVTHASPSKTSWDSSRSAVVVDLSATDAVMSPPCARFYVGVTGNATVRFAGDLGTGGADTLLTGLVAGQVYRFEIAVFRKIGTTATGIVALY